MGVRAKGAEGNIPHSESRVISTARARVAKAHEVGACRELAVRIGIEDYGGVRKVPRLNIDGHQESGHWQTGSTSPKYRGIKAKSVVGKSQASYVGA